MLCLIGVYMGYNIWKKDSPAVVVAAQTTLSIGVFEGVVRVLEGLVPEEAGFTTVQAGLVLEAPVVLSVGSVTLWEERNEIEKVREFTGVCSEGLDVLLRQKSKAWRELLKRRVKGSHICDLLYCESGFSEILLCC